MSEFGRELVRVMTERGIGVRQLARALYVNPSHISNIRSGRARPSAGLAETIDEYLGAGGRLAAFIPPGARPVTDSGEVTAIAPDRRPLSDAAAGADSLASALTDLTADSQQQPVTDLGALTALVDAARVSYQNCRYEKLADDLSSLITTLNTSCAVLQGASREQACVLSADAHHVAAGLMLKRGDLGLATLAADRSMRAALASGDPVAIAASARIVTHALMGGGHLSAAVSMATGHATRLARDLPGHTPQSLSVYGALLLRGAVAAAVGDDRGTAAELLAEAEEAAKRLGLDANYCWTAFGPVNTLVHRVSISVTLGDAGAAIDAARGIDLREIAVTERKATLLVDTARAFMQRGRHEHAYRALRAAHHAAPEEVTGRPAVRALVHDLAATAPVSIRRDVFQFAASIGVIA